MKLYGVALTRRELEARVGRVDQLGGLRRYRLEFTVKEEAERVVMK